MRKLIIFFCLLQSLIIYPQTRGEKSNIGFWFYQDGYTTKQLILRNNNKFYWYYSSCEGDLCYKGKYIISNDTIYLYPKKWDDQKFVLRDNKIFSYQGQNKDYPEFQPLRMVNKQDRLKCNYKKMEFEIE